MPHMHQALVTEAPLILPRTRVVVWQEEVNFGILAATSGEDSNPKSEDYEVC